MSPSMEFLLEVGSVVFASLRRNWRRLLRLQSSPALCR
jgi:hypothetical protein